MAQYVSLTPKESEEKVDALIQHIKRNDCRILSTTQPRYVTDEEMCTILNKIMLFGYTYPERWALRDLLRFYNPLFGSVLQAGFFRCEGYAPMSSFENDGVLPLRYSGNGEDIVPSRPSDACDCTHGTRAVISFDLATFLKQLCDATGAAFHVDMDNYRAGDIDYIGAVQHPDASEAWHLYFCGNLTFRDDFSKFHEASSFCE